MTFELNSVTTGDAQELCSEIPDNSIDMIFTDPPYAKQFIPLYGWLCNEAMRVLKDGGFCCFIASSLYLDQIFRMAIESGLRYYFKVETLNTKDAPIIWPRKMLNRSKPILMWTKGNGSIVVPNMGSIYKGQGPDKRYHDWGQDEGSARYVISYVLGDRDHPKYQQKRPATLLEPFCGGGATLQACSELGVDYIAFEIDETAANISRNRMNGFTPSTDDELGLFVASNP